MENKTNETVLTMTLKDSISVKLDTAVINISVANTDDNDLCESYEEAYKKCAEKTATLISLLKNNGVKHDSIKTDTILVSPIYTNVTNKKESGGIFNRDTETSYSRRLIGYGHRSFIQVKMPSNTENLAELYCKIASSKEVKNTNIDFMLEDTEVYKDEVIKKIISKANGKAELIADSSDLRVVGIQSIDLGSTSSRVIVQNYYDDCCSFDCDCDYDEFGSSMAIQHTHSAIESMLNKEQEITESLTIKYLLGK